MEKLKGFRTPDMPSDCPAPRPVTVETTLVVGPTNEDDNVRGTSRNFPAEYLRGIIYYPPWHYSLKSGHNFFTPGRPQAPTSPLII